MRISTFTPRGDRGDRGVGLSHLYRKWAFGGVLYVSKSIFHMTYIRICNMNIDHNLTFEDLTERGLNRKGQETRKLLRPDLFSMKLIERSDLRNLKIYKDVGLYYIYDKQKGSYVTITLTNLKLIIGQIIVELGLVHLGGRAYKYIDAICRNLEVDHVIGERGTPQFLRGYLVMENGVFNLATQELTPWDPKYFIPSSLPFAYTPGAEAPHFLKYLDDITEGFEDRKEFLRAFFYATLFQRVDLQVFLYLYGVGSTGKSTLGLIASALMGLEGVYTTTLKALNSDPFEVFNLIGRKLVLINDTEKYEADLSVLKAYVGGDSLRGRVMYTQGTTPVRGEGLIWAIGNQPLATRDNTNSVWRRLRAFKTARISRSRVPLLSFVEGKAVGHLAQELPGILNWVLGSSSEKLDKYIVNYEQNVPSLRESLQESRALISPIQQWIKEEVLTGHEIQGSYLGYKIKDSKGERERVHRRSLYPAYYAWAARNGLRPLNHIHFTAGLLEVCQNEGIPARKVRRAAGAYIEGLALSPHIFDRDYELGSTLMEDEPSVDPRSTPIPEAEIVSTELPLKAGVLDVCSRPHIPQRDKPHPKISKHLYGRYMGLLKHRTPLKVDLNLVSKKISLDVCYSLLEEILREKRVSSEDYREGVKGVLKKGVQHVISFGGIPYTYKRMGVSPRIIPQNYGISMNSAKNKVRDHVYNRMGIEAQRKGFVLLDLDLKSCYTSILLGLYPQELRVLQLAIEKEGLWNYIKKEFERNGRGDCFNKPAVKICVYSSFFLGGNKAMMEGILESFRNDTGMTQKEFRFSQFYEDAYKIASEVSYEMQNSEVISDFRDISAYMKKSYMDDYMIGPTGHSYLVSEESFRTAYPNYLMSYEFALLAQATLEAIEKYPQVTLIGHYHDGNVIAFPQEVFEESLQYLKDRVLVIGRELGLSYPQVLEVKKIYTQSGSPDL